MIINLCFHTSKAYPCTESMLTQVRIDLGYEIQVLYLVFLFVLESDKAMFAFYS